MVSWILINIFQVMAGCMKAPCYNLNLAEMEKWLNKATSQYSQEPMSYTAHTKYGPVTMIVPATGHQVRCISWVQMGTFNEEIGFLCGLKFFALNIFCGEYLQSSLHLMLQIWWKRLLWKMCQ